MPVCQVYIQAVGLWRRNVAELLQLLVSRGVHFPGLSGVRSWRLLACQFGPHVVLTSKVHELT